MGRTKSQLLKNFREIQGTHI